MHVIETDRLLLRPFEPGDAGDLFDLNADPEVLAHTGDPPFESIEAARQFIDSYDQYQKYGVGRWAVIDKDSKRFIGWCGLKYSPEPDEYDIGFRFRKDQWNQGFATEAALACIEFGFDRLRLSRIVGRAMTANLASVAVLKKIGLRFLKPFDFEGRDGVIYCIDRQEYTGSEG